MEDVYMTCFSNGIHFDYVHKKENEVEIVRWHEPQECAIIPQMLESGERVVSIGPKAFAKMPKLKKIFVPDSVNHIAEQAFYCFDESMYIYGALYDMGWSNMKGLQETCMILLPSKIYMDSPDALYRITAFTDRRHGRERFENNLIVRVPHPSETAALLQDHGWKIYKIKCDHMLLVRDDSHPFYDSWYGEMRLTNRLFSLWDQNLDTELDKAKYSQVSGKWE